MRKLIFFSIAVVLVIAAGVILDPIVPRVAPTPIHPDEIRAQVQRLQTLATSEFEYRDVVYFDRELRIFGLRTVNQEILFSIDIVVTAGVDLATGFEIERNASNGREVFLTVEEPKVLSVEAKEDSIEQYFVRERWNEIDWVAVSERVEEAKRRNANDAIDRGILTHARVQSETILRNMLSAGGYTEIHIRYRPGDEKEIRG